MRHRRNAADGKEDTGYRQPDAGICKLAADLASKVALIGHAGDDHGGGDRKQKGRDGGNQRVTDRQYDVTFARLARAQPVRCHADGEACDDVDRKDQDRRNRVSLHEFARTIHGAIEIRLGRDFAATGLGFFRRNQSGGEIGVDRHLFAGQGIEGEARGNFGDAARTLGHDDEVDDHQDQEDENTDDEIATDQERAECLDDLACGGFAFMPLQQDDARRCHVQSQSQQRGEQQHRWEGGEVQWPGGIHSRHQDCDRERNVEDEEYVQHEAGQRNDHQQYDDQDRTRQGGGAHV